MLTPKLLDGCTTCGDPICSNIESLIAEINCKIAQISDCLFNSIIFGFNSCCESGDLGDLLHYRRILTARMMNEQDVDDDFVWACGFPLDYIISRVKLMSTGCIPQECCDECIPVEKCEIGGDLEVTVTQL